ncbi:MAG: hypothetical protein IJA69_05585, partial [Clostridia bacterium]|nr:hypothetical protein [Clostridia bacterium]
NKNNFLKLKNNLKNIKINFFESDIKNLKILRQYDIILLSNISDYLLGFGENKLANYFDLICKLKSLNNNVVFGYLYDIENKTKRSEIDEPQKREKYFKNKCYNEFCFESAISGKTDAILILKGE